MDNIEKNPIRDLMQNTMENVKNILQTDTVTGDPIYTPDGITLVPISRISVGFGGGGVEFGAARRKSRGAMSIFQILFSYFHYLCVSIA